MTPDADLLRAFAQEAQRLGFSAMGIAAPDSIPQAPPRLAAFLAAGRHGGMDWLAAAPERRSNPAVLWSAVRSIIMLGVNYGPDEDPRAALARPCCGAISVYARGDDYHELIKSRLKQLARWLTARAGGDVKVFVDTAAIMEKPLAASAGLGWQGKHTNLVSREFGSWLFLGAIFTTLTFAPTAPERDHCGNCRACLDACPTSAFPAPYQLDARRCISYLTIEHKGPVPTAMRATIGNRIFGCDDCLAACPWNKFARIGSEAKLAARDQARAPALAELAALDDAAFRARFPKSPIKRTGRNRFLRNVLIAIGNSRDPRLVAAARPHLDDDDALVRGTAVWALAQLLAPAEFDALRDQRISREADAMVRAEWQREEMG